MYYLYPLLGNIGKDIPTTSVHMTHRHPLLGNKPVRHTSWKISDGVIHGKDIPTTYVHMTLGDPLLGNKPVYTLPEKYQMMFSMGSKISVESEESNFGMQTCG